MLCVLGLLNFFNIPYVVFVILLRAFLSDPSTPALEMPNALRTHTVLVTGAVASLGYGTVCCTFVLREVRSHEHLAPVFGVPVLALVLGQITSVPLTMAVFAAGLSQLRSASRVQQRAASRARQRTAPEPSPRTFVQGVLVEPVDGGIVLSDLEGLTATASRDATLFARAIVFAQGYEDAVRERALMYLDAALYEGSRRAPHVAVDTAAVRGASVRGAAVRGAAVRGAAVRGAAVERSPIITECRRDRAGPARTDLPTFTSTAMQNVLVPVATYPVVPQQRL
jgi:hypothetical protein